MREIPADEANQILAKHAASGFEPIFNGQNLAAWAGPIENYEVKDGLLRCKPNEGGTIYFNKELTDFMARVEFKLPAGGNNGLAIRYPGQGDTAYEGMCELQILDDGHPRYKSLDPRQVARVGLRHGRGRQRLLAAGRPVELRGSHCQRIQDQGRAQRHGDPRRRSQQGQ